MQAFPAIFEFLKQETGVAGMCKPFRSQCDYHCRGPLLQSRCLEVPSSICPVAVLSLSNIQWFLRTLADCQ